LLSRLPIQANLEIYRRLDNHSRGKSMDRRSRKPALPLGFSSLNNSGRGQFLESKPISSARQDPHILGSDIVCLKFWYTFTMSLRVALSPHHGSSYLGRLLRTPERVKRRTWKTWVVWGTKVITRTVPSVRGRIWGVSDLSAANTQTITEMCCIFRDTPWCIIWSNIAAGPSLSLFCRLPSMRCRLRWDWKTVRLHSTVAFHLDLELFPRSMLSMHASAPLLMGYFSLEHPREWRRRNEFTHPEVIEISN
jgi:hypothetical protein